MMASIRGSSNIMWQFSGPRGIFPQP